MLRSQQRSSPLKMKNCLSQKQLKALSIPVTMTTFKSKLNAFVSNAEGVNDLVPLLKRLSLNQLKSVINHNLDQMEQGEIRTICVDSCLIDYALSKHAIVHILSFVPLQTSIGIVSHEFNELFAINQNNIYFSCNVARPIYRKQLILEKREEITRFKTEMDSAINSLKKEYEHWIEVAAHDL